MVPWHASTSWCHDMHRRCRIVSAASPSGAHTAQWPSANTVVYREIETAVPDERILVLFVPYILLTRSYNIKVNIFGLNEVKIEIESPGAALCTCLVPNLYSLRYPKWYFVHYHYSNKFHYIFQIWCYIPDYTDIYYLEYGLHWLVQMQLNIFRCTNVQ